MPLNTIPAQAAPASRAAQARRRGGRHEQNNPIPLSGEDAAVSDRILLGGEEAAVSNRIPSLSAARTPL